MRIFVTITLVVVGIIHLLPVVGVLSAERLAELYGIDVTGPDLEILMRHRAVLFGLLGAFLVYAAFRPRHQGLALVAGLVSVASFLALAYTVGGYTANLQRVVVADVVALVLLSAGGLVHLIARRRGSR